MAQESSLEKTVACWGRASRMNVSYKGRRSIRRGLVTGTGPMLEIDQRELSPMFQGLGLQADLGPGTVLLMAARRSQCPQVDSKVVLSRDGEGMASEVIRPLLNTSPLTPSYLFLCHTHGCSGEWGSKFYEDSQTAHKSKPIYTTASQPRARAT